MSDRIPQRTETAQMPTLPGKAAGIVGWDPMVLQCRDCGVTHTGERNPAAEIILSGFRFHTCEGPTGMRRCPNCHATVTAACPNRSTSCRGDSGTPTSRLGAPMDDPTLIGPDGFTRLTEIIASDAALVYVAQAEALRAAARRFVEDVAVAWGGDSQWLTTGTRVAEVVACVLREWAADMESECLHEWIDRPESDTRECLICGTEVAG